MKNLSTLKINFASTAFLTNNQITIKWLKTVALQVKCRHGGIPVENKNTIIDFIMKRKGCSLLAYGEQRDKELYDKYRKELSLHVREDGTIDNMAAVTAAVLSPCSRFWISEEVAATNIRKFKENPHLLEKMIETKREMYRELMKVFDALRNDPKNSDLNDKQVAYLASDMPVSKFYMTPGSAMVRICAERKKRMRSTGQFVKGRHVIDEAFRTRRKNLAVSDMSTPKKPDLPKWTEFRPRPMNWHIKKRVRTAIQYVIRWGDAFDW